MKLNIAAVIFLLTSNSWASSSPGCFSNVYSPQKTAEGIVVEQVISNVLAEKGYENSKSLVLKKRVRVRFTMDFFNTVKTNINSGYMSLVGVIRDEGKTTVHSSQIVSSDLSKFKTDIIRKDQDVISDLDRAVREILNEIEDCE